MRPTASYALAMTGWTGDFDGFHAGLAAAIRARDAGAAAAADVGVGRSLAFRLPEGRAYTYRTRAGGVDVQPGADASAVVDLDDEAFADLATERCTIFGLLYPGRLQVASGSFDEVAAWEAALANLWFGRPIYDHAAIDLRDRDGRPLDLGASFSLGDVDDADAAHFLHTAGFAVLRGVFTRDEIAAFDEEVRRLHAAASPDDHRSWWATDRAGNEVCCRLTYANERSELIAALQDDPRLTHIASWHGAPLRTAHDRLDGYSVVMKNSDVVHGLSDLPWHRDCGMGGHPVLCPSVLIGIQLDRADAANGQLCFLAGSHHHTNRIDDVGRHPEWPVVPIDAEPGDVTVHYAHVMHAAPPPAAADAQRRTIYVSFNNPAVFDVVPRGRGYNDVVFSRGDGRVLAPTEIV